MIRTTLEELAAHLERRKAELGLAGRDYVPVNDGARRTEAKRELLRAVEENARAQGREPRFKSRR